MSDGGLLLVAVAGIAAIVAMILALRLPPFFALLIGALGVGLVSGLPAARAVKAVHDGLGGTLGTIAPVLALGAIHGGLLTRSGGAALIGRTLLRRVGPGAAPWAIAVLSVIVGLPLFFEVGLVVLMPVVLAMAAALPARDRISPALAVALPSLAGLSVAHGLIPPHPGPLAAMASINAPLGPTMLLGLAVAVPAAVIAGPIFARFGARGVVATPPIAISEAADVTHSLSFGRAFAVMVLPIVLIIMGLVLSRLSHGLLQATGMVLADPSGALLLAVLIGGPLLFADHAGARTWTSAVSPGIVAIAEITLVVGAGGALKQVLIEAGTGRAVGALALAAAVPPLLLGWLVAVAIRLATGSATVAALTAAGLLTNVASGLSPTMRSLLVLAIGAGSLFFSHVNDGGFWLVKAYLGLSVRDTIRTWSFMETIISVIGLAAVMTLGVFIA